MHPEDLKASLAYLRSRPLIKNKVPAPKLPARHSKR